MNQIILDASVAVKWHVEEDLSDKATALLKLILRKKIKAIVPGFFYTEIASACWLQVRRKWMLAKESLEVMDQMQSLPLATRSDHELADVALENALRLDVATYDGLYLALAEIYLAPVVTADKKLVKACEGQFDWIEYLGDFKI